MFLLWCGDVLPKVYIFVPRLVSGTGRGFGSAPQQKHTRWQQYLDFEMTIRVIIILTLVSTSLVAFGQKLDSVSIDLKRLTDLNFFKKYSFYDDSTTKKDIEVTKLIWSLGQVREINEGLRNKGVKTLTRIDERPTEENPYYIVGHYQLPTRDHVTRMAFYRVDSLLTAIDYQDIKDFSQDKWNKIR
jgi:hypothetical protein